jgi:hypothetical protein
MRGNRRAVDWSRPVRLSSFALFTLFVLVLPSSACVTTRAWEREKLASPAMNPSMGDDELSTQYRAKVLESRAAGGLPGHAPGGGCGCTQ